MAETYSTGRWKPNPGEDEEFIAAWTEFARWASEMDGAGTVRLTRDLREEGRYVSFAPWESVEAMRAWKDSEEFKPRMGRVQKHVDEFSPTELEVVAAVEKGVLAETV